MIKIYIGNFNEKDEVGKPADFYSLLNCKEWMKYLDDCRHSIFPFSEKEIYLSNQKAYKIADDLLNDINFLLNSEYNQNFSLKDCFYLTYNWLIQTIMLIMIREKFANDLMEKYVDRKFKIQIIESSKNFDFQDYNDFLQRGLLNPDFHGFITSFFLKNKINAEKIFITSVDFGENSNMKGKVSSKIHDLVYAIYKFFFWRVNDLQGINILQRIIFILILKFKKRNSGVFPLIENKKYIDYDKKAYLEILKLLLLNEFKHFKKNGAGKKSKAAFLVGPNLDKCHFEALLNGEQLIGIQHGAHYGINKSSMHEIEYKRGEFVSWGWNHSIFNNSKDYKITPLPFPSLFLWAGIKRKIEDSIYFISSLVLCPDFRIYSMPKSNEWIEYLDGQKRFYEYLKPALKQKYIYRPFPKQSYVTFQGENYIKHFFPEIKLHLGKIKEKLINSKLVVLDAPDTSFFYRLVLNAPTIMIWNPKTFDFSDNFNALYTELQENKIVFQNSIAAAEFINQNFSILNSWWNSTSLQKVRDKFCEKYALNDENWFRKWIKFLGMQ